MMIPPNEDVLVLAERWLKLLSDLGRAQATLSAYRSALSHYFAFCSHNSIEPEKARFEDLAVYIRPQLWAVACPAISGYSRTGRLDNGNLCQLYCGSWTNEGGRAVTGHRRRCPAICPDR